VGDVQCTPGAVRMIPMRQRRGGVGNDCRYVRAGGVCVGELGGPFSGAWQVVFLRGFVARVVGYARVELRVAQLLLCHSDSLGCSEDGALSR